MMGKILIKMQKDFKFKVIFNTDFLLESLVLLLLQIYTITTKNYRVQSNATPHVTDLSIQYFKIADRPTKLQCHEVHTYS